MQPFQKELVRSYESGMCLRIPLKHGMELSVQCNIGSYCSPRNTYDQELAHPDLYTHYEVALFDEENNFMYPKVQNPELKKWTDDHWDRMDEGQETSVAPYMPAELVQLLINEYSE